MSVTDRVLINRRFLCCACRILKEYILDSEQENEEKIASFLDRATRAIFDNYRYLNLYITHVLPAKERKNNPDNDNPQKNLDLSYLTSDDEYFAEVAPKERIKTMGEVNTTYNLSN